MISLEDFLALPTEEVARLVRAAGPQVCVFPINGTRRWFMLEHGNKDLDDPIQAYMDLSSENHIALYKLFFDHGIDTLLTPEIGPDILLRGDEYMQHIGSVGMERLANGADFLAFYNDYDVRVRFYGDYRKALQSTKHKHIPATFDQAAQKTRTHTRCRLFFGVFANDATETMAELSIQFFQTHKRPPNRREIVEMYYGEYVDPATIFIGFDKFSVFDYPLLSTGEEDLYFMVAPSPYMNERSLRTILFDHLYKRSINEPEYAKLSSNDFNFMATFYENHRNTISGTGELVGDIWYPILDI